MEPPCPVLVLAAGDVATSRSQPPKSAGTHRDCRKLSRMGPKNERQIAWTVKQAAADYEHLARLHAKIKDTAAVIERGRSAWAESVALLTGLAGPGGGGTAQALPGLANSKPVCRPKNRSFQVGNGVVNAGFLPQARLFSFPLTAPQPQRFPRPLGLLFAHDPH